MFRLWSEEPDVDVGHVRDIPLSGLLECAQELGRSYQLCPVSSCLGWFRTREEAEGWCEWAQGDCGAGKAAQWHGW